LVVKLHGSVNWAVTTLDSSWHDWPHVLYIDRENGLELREHKNRAKLLETLNSQSRDLQWQYMRWWFALAQLGPDKECQRIPGMDYLWQTAESLLKRSDLWVFVGFSMSEFDRSARELFQRAREVRRQPIAVIDPSPKVIERFKQVLGREIRSFQVKHENFAWNELDRIDPSRNRSSTFECARTGELNWRGYN
jgi:hypothetical protein